MHVVLLEDDVDLARAIVDHLVAAGHAVEWLTLVTHAEARFAATDSASPPIELLLLAQQLPDDDALGLLRRLRSRAVRCPVIALTAHDPPNDRIRGLQAGADDYLVKPFALDEMLARIDAVSVHCVEAAPRSLRRRALVLDFDARLAYRGDKPIRLTPMEWRLLASLAQRPQRIWSRGEIGESLAGGFGREARTGNSVEAIISHLRRKLGARLIETHRGRGYRLAS